MRTHLNKDMFFMFYLLTQLIYSPNKILSWVDYIWGTTFIMADIIKIEFWKYLMNAHMMNLAWLTQKWVFMCTRTSLTKYAKINPPHFSFLQLLAIFLFIIVRFWMTNILVSGLNLMHLPSFFLFTNAFLQYFLFANQIIVFWN